jgi:hypothetical protein
MDSFEATVEIVKAMVGQASPGQSSIGHFVNEENRKKFLTGIEELYKTLESLNPDFGKR